MIGRPRFRGEMDCGDNSCLFATSRGGMRTNGGCQCIENLQGQLAEANALTERLRSHIKMAEYAADLSEARALENCRLKRSNGALLRRVAYLRGVLFNFKLEGSETAHEALRVFAAIEAEEEEAK